MCGSVKIVSLGGRIREVYSMVRERYLCWDCAFKWLNKVAMGKRVLVRAGSDMVIGRLIAVEYKTSVPRRFNMVVTVETNKGKIALAKWKSLRIIKEGEVHGIQQKK